jgi:hypothetical protein
VGERNEDGGTGPRRVSVCSERWRWVDGGVDRRGGQSRNHGEGGQKGMGKVEAKSLAGPVARKGSMVSSAKEMIGLVEVFPRGVGGRE